MANPATPITRNPRYIRQIEADERFERQIEAVAYARAMVAIQNYTHALSAGYDPAVLLELEDLVVQAEMQWLLLGRNVAELY